MTFQTLEAARPVLRRLRMTRGIFIQHLCQEDRVVLAADGYGVQEWGNGWLVLRRLHA